MTHAMKNVNNDPKSNTSTFEEREQWILSFEAGRIWYNKLRSIHTKRVYSAHLRRLCNWSGFNPDGLVKLKQEAPPNKHPVEALLENFIAKKPFKPTIMNAVRNAVVAFFVGN